MVTVALAASELVAKFLAEVVELVSVSGRDFLVASTELKNNTDRTQTKTSTLS